MNRRIHPMRSRIKNFGTCALGAVLIGLPALASSQSLTTLDYRIDGQAMVVTPSALAVPKGIAGSVGVSVPGEIPPGAFVEAILGGPSFPARRVVGLPNAPLLLPPFSLNRTLLCLQLLPMPVAVVLLKTMSSSISRCTTSRLSMVLKSQ